MTNPNQAHLFTRRRSLALLGGGGAGLIVAGSNGGFALARSTDGHDYVAEAARACSLTAEQEEGPYYVALERVREDIIGGQTGLPFELEITIVNSLTCKPLRHAAIDIWHANAAGVYSDKSVENTLGQTYLRGVQFTDKHGRVVFKTIFPGHYQGRTTHIHLKVHVGSGDDKGKLVGGHVAHTGQMFTPDAINAGVYKLPPYNKETAAIVPHASDQVWTGQHGAEAQLRIAKAGNRIGKGLIGRVTVAVNPKATPAAVGVGGGTGGTPPAYPIVP
jgi:protocatechuate 3,4-dioxygenase beta subunit